MYFIDHYVRYKSVDRFSNENQLLVKSWKEKLETIQPVLDLFSIKIASVDVIKRSERILNHQFSILSGTYSMGDPKLNSSEYIPIPWLSDPKSGHIWDSNVWYRNSRSDLLTGTDIKIPWELSRCQHFILLGEAYNLTGDERYTKEYCNQILDWIKHNPVRYGPNWAVSMEVGIRISNWIVALLYFVKSSEMKDTFMWVLLKSIEEHGRHIMSNLENISLTTSNHYMGNIVGLYFLSILTPGLKKSKKWEAFAKRELEREILRQTFDDGWHFESSTAYHRLVTEMFLYAFLMAEYIDKPFSENYRHRLKKMIEVIGEAMKPDGMIPQIGDNDSGRFLVFRADRDPDSLNIKYLFELANRSLKIKPNINGHASIRFKYAGRYILRNDHMYLMIVAGPKGTAGLGSHAHNDILSIELNVDGEDLLVDPGTGCYTADPIKRNNFRSISQHSSLYWEGLEPCSLQKGIFMLQEEGNLIVEKCELGVEEDLFSAIYEYNGYFHRREIHFKKLEEEIIIKDTCSHTGAILSFVCAPSIKPILNNSGFIISKTVFSFDSFKSIDIRTSQYSPSYGKVVPNKVIYIRLSSKTCICRIKFQNKL